MRGSPRPAMPATMLVAWLPRRSPRRRAVPRRGRGRQCSPRTLLLVPPPDRTRSVRQPGQRAGGTLVLRVLHSARSPEPRQRWGAGGRARGSRHGAAHSPRRRHAAAPRGAPRRRGAWPAAATTREIVAALRRWRAERVLSAAQRAPWLGVERPPPGGPDGARLTDAPSLLRLHHASVRAARGGGTISRVVKPARQPCGRNLRVRRGPSKGAGTIGGDHRRPAAPEHPTTICN